MSQTTKKPKPTTVLISTMQDHPDQVLEWRRGQFEKMGFGKDEARSLATTHIDLNMMSDLLAKGCPHDLAQRILAGTTANGDDPTDVYKRTRKVVSRPAVG